MVGDAEERQVGDTEERQVGDTEERQVGDLTGVECVYFSFALLQS